MDPATFGRPASDAWSDSVDRQEPQSPLVASFTRPPATLRLAGVIDESTYPVLRRALAKAAMAGDGAVRVDMAGVEFCDLGGLRMIVSVAGPSGPTRAAAGQVVIAGLPTPLSDLMHILGWDAAPGVVLLDAHG
jgi:anti-anti-sigma regulatory factor